MTTLSQTPAPAIASDGHKRKLRNYLLDARFQLKFTGYVVGATVVVAGLLGGFLWSTAKELLHETEAAVEARYKAAETSKDIGAATLNNELLKHFDDPAFEKQLRDKSKAIDTKYEDEKKAIIEQRTQLVRRQQIMVFALIGGFTALILIIAFGSIVATHKIVGPLYRIKSMAQQVAAGKLDDPSRKLRDGDEFKDLFIEFSHMVKCLRDHQRMEIRLVDAVMERAKKLGASPEVLGELHNLKTEMNTRIDGVVTSEHYIGPRRT